MRIKPKTVTRSVKVLRNPNPQYVSLVDHGSIQEPFTALKAAKPNGVKPMPISRRDSTTKNASAPKKPEVGVRKIVFGKDVFENEASVKKYLDDNGYDGYSVKSEDNVFVAEGDFTDEDVDDVKTVKMEDGVIGHVGVLTDEGVKKRAAEDEEDEEDEGEEGEEGKGKKGGKRKTYRKSEGEGETVLKFEYYQMHCSTAESVKEVLASGMCDGVPPGVMEIIQASAYAIGNVLSGDAGERATKLAAIGKEIAQLVGKVAEVYDGLSKAKKSENVDKFKETHDAFIADAKAKKLFLPPMSATTTQTPRPADATPSAPSKSVQTPAPGPDQPPHNADATPSAPKTTGSPVTAKPSSPTEYPRPGEAAPAKGEGNEQVAENNNAANEAMLARLGEMLGSAVSKAVDPINQQLADLSKKVEQASAAATNAVESVDKMAARVPTKKSASDAAETGKTTPEVDAQNAQKLEGLRNFRRAIGM